MGDTKQAITTQQVKDYLLEHKDFLLKEQDVLETLVLNTSPQGTISLAQRQVERLQASNQQLHNQLQALIDNAILNNALQTRIHQLSLKLMDTASLAELTAMILSELQQEFNADDVALRLFYHDDKTIDATALKGNIAYYHADDEALKQFDKLLEKQIPICGRLTNSQKTFLFNEQMDQVKSIAFLPLSSTPCAGFLAIASYDENRFHADMATDYLQFLGDIIMRLLRNHHQ